MQQLSACQRLVQSVTHLMCIMYNACVCTFMYAQGYTVLTCVHYDTHQLECITELRVLVYGMEYTHLVHACYCVKMMRQCKRTSLQFSISLQCRDDLLTRLFRYLFICFNNDITSQHVIIFIKILFPL